MFWRAVSTARTRQSPRLLTYPRQVITALPLRRERAKSLPQLVFSFGVIGKRECFLAGIFKEFAVANRIGYVKTHFAGLPSAEKFSRPAQLQISFGNFKTVGGAHHGIEPRLRNFVIGGRGAADGHSDRRDENAMGFLRAATDASAQLMKLRKTKSLGMFDDHDGGVRNVDTDFNHGCGDENLRFIFPKGLHDCFFFFAG